MKKKDLIKALSPFDDETEIVITDLNKNHGDDSGEGSASGIYEHFDVEYIGEDNIPEGVLPFVSLTFVTDTEE